VRLLILRQHLTALSAGAVVISVLTVAPPILHSGFAAGHDTPAHVTYIYLFDRALRQGQFPVRWVEWVAAGHSQPLFNFYQPGLYYLVELVHQIVPSLSMSLKVTVVLLWWCGALFTFLLFERLGLLPGALAALTFAFAPYIVLDVFVRAAYPELAAIALLPGVLWSLDGLMTTGRFVYAPLLAVLTGLMLLCHLPTCLAFSPLVAAYCCRLAWSRERAVRLAVVFLAGTLGFGLAAFYILPALQELRLVRMTELTSAYFDYHRHFVYPSQWVRYSWGFGGSVEGPDDQMSFQIGIVQWITIILACASVVAALRRRRLSGTALDLTFWLCIAAGAMFVMTGSSVVLWDTIGPLRYLQFPWRFLMVVSIACAALAAHLLSLIKSRTWQAAAVICAVALQLGLFHRHLKPSHYILPSTMDIDSRQWSQQPKTKTAAFVELGYFPTAAVRLPEREIGRWSISQGTGTVHEVALGDDRLILEVATKEGLRLTINSHFFPGWRVRMDGQEQAVSGRPRDGYMDVDVPPGGHRIEAVFTNTNPRRLGNSISIVSVAGLLVLLVGSIRVDSRRIGNRIG
jgi:uncharacterized membrane protein